MLVLKKLEWNRFFFFYYIIGTYCIYFNKKILKSNELRKNL